MFGVLKRVWMPLLIVVVVVIAGFAVYRVRGYFGAHGNAGGSSVRFEDTKPFRPKVVIYEIFGPNGAVADINYLDLNATPQRVDKAPLPWSLELSTTDPAVSPIIVAQGRSDTIGCRITVDGVVKDERISNGVNAQTFCLVKSA
ncbi:MmpS family transport accessory protein [Mycobacterium botniense]|uniref:Membrane protein n=1 Tax=Mycobacterium botniense TaxID=84962 RepID=A0A7I9XTV2_9MYCO|nr:MmpS family transport accessory protein [Mycobacterium botniense]GFG73439.1 membrane protein [Mycobacterium botniense]